MIFERIQGLRIQLSFEAAKTLLSKEEKLSLSFPVHLGLLILSPIRKTSVKMLVPRMPIIKGAIPKVRLPAAREIRAKRQTATEMTVPTRPIRRSDSALSLSFVGVMKSTASSILLAK